MDQTLFLQPFISGQPLSVSLAQVSLRLQMCRSICPSDFSTWTLPAQQTQRVPHTTSHRLTSRPSRPPSPASPCPARASPPPSCSVQINCVYSPTPSHPTTFELSQKSFQASLPHYHHSIHSDPRCLPHPVPGRQPLPPRWSPGFPILSSSRPSSTSSLSAGALNAL